MKKYNYNIFDEEHPDEQLILDAVKTFEDEDEYKAYASCLDQMNLDHYNNDDLHGLFLFLFHVLLHQRLVNQDLQKQIDEIRIQQQYQDGKI